MKKQRAKPGTKQGGEYFRIEIQPDNKFVTFRYHDVGDPGHIQRLAGRKENGSWETTTWLISKEDAHIENNKLVPDTKDAKELLEDLSEPIYVKGDVFKASDKSQRKQSKTGSSKSNVGNNKS
jgi:hypothetical protein